MMQSRDTTREVQGARITWEGGFPLKLDTNPYISLWMDCAPGCHTRTEVTSCPPGRGFPAGDHGVLQGSSVEALGCWSGVAVLGEPQTHQGTLRSCSWTWRRLFRVPCATGGAGWLPKGLHTPSFPHPTLQPLTDTGSIPNTRSGAFFSTSLSDNIYLYF